jgi:hypothetical protein
MLIRPLALFLIVSIPRIAFAQPTFTANDFTCAQNLFNAGDLRADYDGNGVLNANDLIRFGQLYASRDPRANCDGSTVPVPSTGWTDLTPPAGAQVFYVAANGNDAAAGTQAAPLKTLAAGWSKLRNGQPDQVLLRCGDTFNIGTIDIDKGSNFTGSKYMVIGAYGTGPRPKVRSSDSAFNIGPVRGFALCDLDIQPSAGHPGNAVWMPEGARDILLEGNYIAGYGVNVASHTVNTGEIQRFKIRRNVIVDGFSPLPQSGHNVFLGDQVDLLLEENVLDRGGRDGGEQTIFRRNCYIHDHGAANVSVIGNVHARSCSDSIQVRPGGQVRNNLSLQNPTGMTWGGNGTFAHNVAIDARDINSTDRRGVGFELSGNGTVEYNLVAHNVNGSDAVTAFGMNSFSGTFRGNFVYDWKAPGNAGWATAVEWNGGGGAVTCDGNRLFMPNNGMIWRHESRGVSGFTYRNGTYFTSTPAGGVGGYQQFSTGSGQGEAWSQWRTRETNSTFLNAAPSYNITMAAYLTSIGVAPGSDAIATFMGQARLQSKQNWRTQYTADGFNDWARARAGVPVFRRN